MKKMPEFKPLANRSKGQLVIRWRTVVWVRNDSLQHQRMSLILNLFTFAVLPGVHAFAVTTVDRFGRRRPTRGGVDGVGVRDRADRNLTPICTGWL